MNHEYAPFFEWSPFDLIWYCPHTTQLARGGPLVRQPAQQFKSQPTRQVFMSSSCVLVEQES